MSIEALAGALVPSGVVIGWLANHFLRQRSHGTPNGVEARLDVVIALLDRVANNTNALPDFVRESREYQIKGRSAMDAIDRLERRHDPE